MSRSSCCFAVSFLLVACAQGPTVSPVFNPMEQTVNVNADVTQSAAFSGTVFEHDEYIDLQVDKAFVHRSPPSEELIRFGNPVAPVGTKILGTVVDYVRYYSAIDWANGLEPHGAYYVLVLNPDPKRVAYLFPRPVQ